MNLMTLNNNKMKKPILIQTLTGFMSDENLNYNNIPSVLLDIKMPIMNG
jgi:hypothetical protein